MGNGDWWIALALDWRIFPGSIALRLDYVAIWLGEAVIKCGC
jgi:hypothetical protein